MIVLSLYRLLQFMVESGLILVPIALVGLYALKVKRDFDREDAARRQRRREGK